MGDELRLKLLTSLVNQKLSTLDDVILLGDKVYSRPPPEPMEIGAPLQAKLLLKKDNVDVGEDIDLEIRLANLSNVPVLLTRIEGIPPIGFELVAKPEYCHFEGEYMDVSSKRLDPLVNESIRLTLRSYHGGIYSVKPRIFYMDGKGHQRVFTPDPSAVRINEIALPGRVSTGFKNLDNLLFGGIPENYSVALTSGSCDERDLLVKKFLETGVSSGEITFYVTIEPSGVKLLAEEREPNFYLFLCNPQANQIIRDLPNVFKMKGVENLTDINIALTSAFRRLDNKSHAKPRRACIEIVSDILLQHGAVQKRRWLTGIIPELRSHHFTSLVAIDPYMHSPAEVEAVKGLLDGEISIYERDLEKFLRIRKLYNETYVETELRLRKEELRTVSITECCARWKTF